MQVRLINLTNIFLLLVIISVITSFESFINGHIVKDFPSSDKEYDIYAMIFPGTKWCGPGNIAEDYDDLGKFRETDMCCRDHDYCDHIISGEIQCGIKNNYRYTRLHCKCDKNFFECLHKFTDYAAYFVGNAYFGVSGKCFRNDNPVIDCLETESILHCKCDKEFYDCLHKVNDNVSNTVGKTYFQFSNGCYREDHPTTGCEETEASFFDKRCVKYSYDKSQSKKYQWFDLPYYNSEKFPDIRGSEADQFKRQFLFSEKKNRM